MSTLVPNFRPEIKIFLQDFGGGLVVLAEKLSKAHLEKAASGTCGHLARNYAFLRTFLVEYPVLLSEDGGRRVDD